MQLVVIAAPPPGPQSLYSGSDAVRVLSEASPHRNMSAGSANARINLT